MSKNAKKIIFLCIIPLIILLAVSCSIIINWTIPAGKDTPEEAILDSYDMQEIVDFRVAGTRYVNSTSIVMLYTTQQGRLLNYNYVERTWRGWFSRGGRNISIPPYPKSRSRWVNLVGDITESQNGQYYIVFGYPLSSQVQRVEVMLSTGEKLQDAITNNVFAVATHIDRAQSIRICTIRAFDNDGHEMPDSASSQC